MATPGNRHCASCIGTLSFPMYCVYGWQPGDVRRPYPTEMDMRSSLLAKLTEPGSTQSMQTPTLAGYADVNRSHPLTALGASDCILSTFSRLKQGITPGAARRYAPR